MHTAVSKSNRLSFDLVSGSEGLLQLQESWHRAELEYAPLCFAQTWAWYWSALTHLIVDPAEIFFVVVHSNRRLTGILPVQIARETYFGVAIRVLRLPSHSHLVEKDWLCWSETCEPQLVAELFDYLSSREFPRWDIADFELPGRSTLSLALEMTLSLAVHSAIQHQNSAVVVDNSSPDNPGNVAAKFRRNIRRLRRRAISRGDLEYKRITNSHALEGAIQSFIDLEDDSWKGGSATSIKADMHLCEFYHNLPSMMPDKVSCEVHLLSLNGTDIAGAYGFLCNEEYHMLKIGYRSAYADLSPGHLLIDHICEYYQATGNVRLINLHSEADWTKTWSSCTQPEYRFLIFNRSFKSWLLHMLYRIKTIFGHLLHATRKLLVSPRQDFSNT